MEAPADEAAINRDIVRVTYDLVHEAVGEPTEDSIEDLE
jgi:hypothetical protein